MFSRRTLVVIKRELKMRLLSRTFIIMTLLIPVFIFGLIGIQAFLYSFSEEENPRLVIISGSTDILSHLEEEFSAQEYVQDGSYIIFYENIRENYFQQKLAELKPAMLEEKLTGIVYIPSSSLQKKEIRYYSTNPNNITLFNRIKPAINRAFVDVYFSGKNLSEEEVNFVRDEVDISGFRITKGEEIEEEGYGNMILLFLFSFLLYMSLIFMGQMTMNSVVEEKNSRIVEVLLSSANSTELMTGKILGTAVTGLIQMAIWLLPFVVLATTTWFMLPPDFAVSVNIGFIFYFLLNFFIALITFVGLFAAVGAIFDNPQDAQSGIWPLLLLIMIPFFIALSLQANPQNSIAKAASFVPFASLIVMPARMTLVEVPLWQVLVSAVVNITIMFLIFPLTGKIYRVGILITGKKPRWSEVAKWIRS